MPQEPENHKRNLAQLLWRSLFRNVVKQALNHDKDGTYVKFIY